MPALRPLSNKQAFELMPKKTSIFDRAAQAGQILGQQPNINKYPGNNNQIGSSHGIKLPNINSGLNLGRHRF